MENHMDTQKEW